VPPSFHVLFLKIPRSVSEPRARNVALVWKKPMRLNVQLPSALSAVAKDPKRLRNRRVAADEIPYVFHGLPPAPA